MYRFLLCNNVAYTSRVTMPKGARLMQLIHKRTRSVCVSRDKEWLTRHWRLRTADYSTGRLLGLSRPLPYTYYPTSLRVP